MHCTRHDHPVMLVALLLVLLTVSPVWSQQPLELQEQQGISFVSGGLGADERDQLRTMQDEFNLKLVFAIDAGNYLSDIDVRIMDQQGNTLVETRSDGPILMAKLPAGTYSVAVANQGDSKERTVEIGSQDLAEVTLTW